MKRTGGKDDEEREKKEDKGEKTLQKRQEVKENDTGESWKQGQESCNLKGK